MIQNWYYDIKQEILKRSLMRKIHFLPQNIDCLFSKEESVLAIAINNKISIEHSCGGNATCGTCLVEVISPPPQSLDERNELEQEMAIDRNYKVSERLACQLRPQNGLIVKTK